MARAASAHTHDFAEVIDFVSRESLDDYGSRHPEVQRPAPFTPSDPDDTVLSALGLMAKHDIGAVLVLDGDDLVGILTERDYARKVALVGRVVEGLAGAARS